MPSRQAALIAAVLSLSVMSVDAARGSLDPAPSVGHRGSPLEPVGGAPSGCFQQQEGATGVGIISQRFEPAFMIYNNRAADDFTLTRSCSVRSVDVAGMYYSAGGPADSESVILYENRGGRPGRVISRETVVGHDDRGTGSFHIVLTRPVRLGPGSYWLSVRVNMDFAVGGQWGWETTSGLSGVGARWKNRGNGFATGCTTYKDMQACLGDIGQGPDLMFSVNRTE